MDLPVQFVSTTSNTSGACAAVIHKGIYDLRRRRRRRSEVGLAPLPPLGLLRLAVRDALTRLHETAAADGAALMESGDLIAAVIYLQ